MKRGNLEEIVFNLEQRNIALDSEVSRLEKQGKSSKPIDSHPPLKSRWYPSKQKYLVLMDDGTGKNDGHVYGTADTYKEACEKTTEAEGLASWCVGAWIELIIH